MLVYVESCARFRICFFPNLFGEAVVNHLLHEVHVLFFKCTNHKPFFEVKRASNRVFSVDEETLEAFNGRGSL